MKIRKATSADYEKVVSMFVEHKFALHKREWFDWKHFTNPCGNSILLVAENKGEIVATVASQPKEFLYSGRTYIAHEAVDGFIRPEVRGSKLFSKMMKEIIEHIPGSHEGNHFHIGFSELPQSQNALKSAGWEKLTDSATITFILNAKTFRSLPLGNFWVQLLKIPLVVARAVMFSYAKPTKLKVNRIDKSIGDMNEFIKSHKVSGGRSDRFLNWRITQNCKDNVSFYSFTVGSELNGYAITKKTAGSHDVYEWRFDLPVRQCVSALLKHLYQEGSNSVSFKYFNDCEETLDLQFPPLGFKRKTTSGSVYLYGADTVGLPKTPKDWNITYLDSDW